MPWGIVIVTLSEKEPRELKSLRKEKGFLCYMDFLFFYFKKKLFFLIGFEGCEELW